MIIWDLCKAVLWNATVLGGLVARKALEGTLKYIEDPDKFWGIEEHPTLEETEPFDEKKWDCPHCGTRL